MFASNIDKNGIGNRSTNLDRLQHRNCTVLGSILGPIWGPFSTLWPSKRHGGVKVFDVWYSACSVFGSEAPRRSCPEQFWHHFAIILERLFEENWYRNSPIQTINATTEQHYDPTNQQPHNPTIRSLRNQHALLATRWLDAGWWGSAKRKQ